MSLTLPLATSILATVTFGCVMLSMDLPSNAEPTRASMMKQLSAEENFLPSLSALSAFHD